MVWAKKNSYKELDNEKKFLRLENSPPPPPPPQDKNLKIVSIRHVKAGNPIIITLITICALFLPEFV